ncbi:MAG: hypothetical protein JNK11_04735 [Alphaproteobacteria bacterium]|nr:hypothetical protein [Alphaproteobacteria bacterium]
MSRTVLLTYDLQKSKKDDAEVETLVIELSNGEVVQIGPGVWLFRTEQDLGEVAARIGGIDGGKDRWMAVNVSNRAFAWAGQNKDAHKYMAAINQALLRAPRH